jgi:hypothetical protein
MKFPELGTKEYTKMKLDGRLIMELGEVILQQYGEKEASELLAKFKATEKDKEQKTT